MNTEAFVIKNFCDKSAYIGDDAAVVDKLLYSQDAFFENIHFKRKWMSSYQIGYKAMMVNLSDAIAMNAQPQYALLTLAIPKHESKASIASLMRGITDAATSFNCEIIGGDTISNSKLDISITIISQSQKVLYRKSVKEGDLLAFTGGLGDSGKALKQLFRTGKCASHSKFMRPILRQSFIKKAYRHLNGGLDISDGLFEDSKKLTAMINRHYEVHYKIPKQIACSGEEYEMLVSFPAKNLKALKRISQQTRTPLTVFATVKRASRKSLCKANHF